MSIITVENLGKKYIIRHQGRRESYTALRDVIANKFVSAGKKLAHAICHAPSTLRSASSNSLRPAPYAIQPATEEFWALKDVSFEIKQGEAVGIIGRNGAGKSTLLKLLSRITEPTTGRIHLKGRVASLLEVGTGFHPELTGRENIYLNGAILGMTKAEIKRKFDEIVAFSGVEKFLDTPVKRYSSGMYIRLAFAVAAHLEPEILLVDEVLAVGDAAFQKKCLGKMGDVTKEGRTVLFVSHNMGAVQQLTKRSILLNEGKVVLDGKTSIVVKLYCKNSLSLNINTNLKTTMSSFNIKKIKFDAAAQENGFNKPIKFDIDLFLKRSMMDVSFGLGIYNSIGARIVTSRCVIDKLLEGETNLSIVISDHHLPPGNYALSLGISIPGSMLIYKENLLTFELSDVNLDEPCLIPYLSSQRDKIGTFIPCALKKR